MANNLENPSTSRIFGLDLLRTLAILLVCLLHGREFMVPFYPNFPNLWIVDGVDLFFCLSGFLIGRIFINDFRKTGNLNFANLLQFWKRRWYRTLPNYYLILAVNVLFFYYRNRNFNIDNLWKYLLFLQNFSVVQCFHFFTESWSLAIEEWFYIVFPFLCSLLKFFTKWDVYKVVLISTLTTIIGSLIARNIIISHFPELDIHNWIKEFRNVVIFRIDSIVYGVLGAYLSLKYNSIWLNYKNAMLLLGISGLYYMNFYYPLHNSNYYKVNYDALNSLSILSMLPFLSSWNINPRIWISRFVTFISKISYSMYLINASLIFNILNIYNKAENGNRAILNYTLFWLLTIFFSFLIYQYFERPTTALRDKKIIQ